MVEYIDIHIHTIIEYIPVSKVNLSYKQLIILIKAQECIGIMINSEANKLLQKPLKCAYREAVHSIQGAFVTATEQGLKWVSVALFSYPQLPPDDSIALGSSVCWV